MKKKVLIIDDEKDFLKITKLNLERTGKYEVMTSSDAKDIISQVHSFSPDIILIDMLMPGIGGLEACQMLNSDSVSIKIPIIVLTALDKNTDKLKAYKLGIIDYIVKPVDVDNFIAKIEKALQYK
jgi:DNA-binding response OmpR family regulator